MDNYLDIIKDPREYLPRFCKIKTKEEGIQPFLLKPVQLELFNDLDKDTRFLILKARQMGMSTAVCGYIYHKVVTTPGINAVLVGYDKDATSTLLETMKLFWESTPIEIRPTLRINNKYEMVFPKLKSKITVLPSTTTAGRGMVIHYLLVTEFAFWKNPEETYTALSECVPESGKIIIETTPNGTGNLYHQMWVDPDNGYKKLRYGWEWEYTAERMERKKKEIGEKRFAQEYGLTFLSSGNSYFNLDDIEKQADNILSKKGTSFEWEQLRVYSPPVRDHRYVISADTSEGVTGGDYAAAVVLDRMTGEEVGMFRKKVNAFEFAKLLNKWGRKFGNALVIVEVNNHGLTALTELRNMGYPNLYFRKQYGKTDNLQTNRMGWKTNIVTKPILLDGITRALAEGSITIHSEEIYEELKTIEFLSSGNIGASSGHHDDLVMALGMAIQGLQDVVTTQLTQIEDETVVL